MGAKVEHLLRREVQPVQMLENFFKSQNANMRTL